MHRDELWQMVSPNGERVLDGGYPAELDNPPFGPGNLVVVCAVWLCRQGKNDLELLFQKRSSAVDRNAGKWDVSAGGHVNYGETLLDAAVREVHEEIGVELEPEKLVYMFTTISPSHANIQRNYFLYDWTGKDDDFRFDDHEVAAVKWVPFADFDEFVDANVKDAFRKDKAQRKLIKTFIKKRGNYSK